MYITFRAFYHIIINILFFCVKIVLLVFFLTKKYGHGFVNYTKTCMELRILIKKILNERKITLIVPLLVTHTTLYH